MEVPQVIFLQPSPLYPHIYSNGHICLEDEVDVNRKAILQMPKNVNFSNESSCQVHGPNTSIPLPFEMVSPIWKSLEALNVFKHIPQMPHFRKLARYSFFQPGLTTFSKYEEEREGRAIGMMVTYSNMAESIPRLQMCSKVTDFEAKIACLISLEENGFVVDPIRSHLQELLALRTNDVNSALKQTKLEIALANKELENMNSCVAVNGYEAEFTDVRKKLEELRKSVSELEEKEKAILMGKARVLVSASEAKTDLHHLGMFLQGREVVLCELPTARSDNGLRSYFHGQLMESSTMSVCENGNGSSFMYNILSDFIHCKVSLA